MCYYPKRLDLPYMCAIIQNLQGPCVPLDQILIPAYVPFSVVIDVYIHEIINREFEISPPRSSSASVLFTVPASLSNLNTRIHAYFHSFYIGTYWIAIPSINATLRFVYSDIPRRRCTFRFSQCSFSLILPSTVLLEMRSKSNK